MTYNPDNSTANPDTNPDTLLALRILPRVLLVAACLPFGWRVWVPVALGVAASARRLP